MPAKVRMTPTMRLMVIRWLMACRNLLINSRHSVLLPPGVVANCRSAELAGTRAVAFSPVSGHQLQSASSSLSEVSLAHQYQAPSSF